MRLAALVSLLLLGVGCAGPGPIVESRTHDVVAGSLRRVAVAPFQLTPALKNGAGPVGLTPAAAAHKVANIVTEAFVDAGIETVAPSDVAKAFEALGRVVPQDPAEIARVVAREFGATAVMTGRLFRYREREGGPAGVLRPASAWYQVELFAAPGGQRLYAARFDQTQQPISSAPLLAGQYPGGGTRWLTVAELSRWGADAVVRKLPAGLQ